MFCNYCGKEITKMDPRIDRPNGYNFDPNNWPFYLIPKSDKTELDFILDMHTYKADCGCPQTKEIFKQWQEQLQLEISTDAH